MFLYYSKEEGSYMNICSGLIKNKKTIIIFLESLCSAWALIQITNLCAMNILAYIFFILLFIFYQKVQQTISIAFNNTIKQPKNTAILSALLFTTFYLLGSYHTLLETLTNRFFQLIILTITFTGLFFIFYYVVFFIICSLKTYAPVKNQTNTSVTNKLPLLCFILCLFFRLPYFLYSFPGILTPDSINQFEQVLGMKPFSNHHPWLHTMTISLFYHLGTIFTDNINQSFAFYTIFQIIFMSFAAAFLIYIMTKYTSSYFLLIGSTLFFAIVPYHNVMAICIWKDTLFSGSMLIFCSCLFYLVKERNSKLNKAIIFLYSLSAFLICLYRSNGWYAFLITLPFLFYIFKQNKIIMYPLHTFIVLSVLIIKGPIMDYYQVEQPDFVESVSIPLQQVSRVIIEDKKISPEQHSAITSVIDITYIKELYVEYFADNMKELVRAGHPEILCSHKLDYLKLWAELGVTYPKTYLDAYTAQTYGYYSPDASYSIADVEGIIPNNTGLYSTPLIGGKLIVKTREILNKLPSIVPFYGSLCSMGSLLWITLLSMFVLLGIQKNKPTLTSIIIWIPNLALIGTLLIATPVATEFRYAYSLAYCLPLYIFACFSYKNENNV